MGKWQKSKRARKTRKQARAAGLPGNFSHPSHTPLTKRRLNKGHGVTIRKIRFRVRKETS